LGLLKAQGLTCKTLARDIQKALTNDLYYKATVIVAVDLLNKKRGTVYLLGHIKNTGPLDIPSDETLTLTKAIMRAGGFTDFSDKKKVKVTRAVGNESKNNKVFVIDVTEILERGKTDKDLKLEPGDIIYVPSRMVNL
jgi:protein involved in polysaccharide export with SLBB domain